MVRNFDIAVVGAGPAGSAAALRLARQGCRVALIERSHFDAARVGESLAPATQPLLMELGVWPQFLELGPLASYGTRSVWGSDEPQDHSHVMSPYGSGWHVDRTAFDHMLAQAAASAGTELLCGAAVVACELSDSGTWLLQLSGAGNAAQLQARVLIDATGRGANLARWVGAQRIIFDRLVGVGTVFRDIDVSREGYILVESTADGWWYSAPIPQNRMMVMLMTDGDLCGRARLSAKAHWQEFLTRAPMTSARIGKTELWGPRVFSSLSQRLRRREFSAPWMAVGDAALAVDPISGSGIVRALRSARAGAETALSLLEEEIPRTPQGYEAECDSACTAYLQERALYYAAEDRWQRSAFWRRRAPQYGACAYPVDMDLHAAPEG